MLLRVLLALALVLALLVSGPMLVLAFGSPSFNKDWRTASHRSAGQAPDPGTTHEALVQVYSSRAFSWRGAFAVHTWLAAKPPGDGRDERDLRKRSNVEESGTAQAHISRNAVCSDRG